MVARSTGATPSDRPKLFSGRWRAHLAEAVARHGPAAALDAAVVAASYGAVLLARFEGSVPLTSARWLLLYLPFVAALYVGCNMVACVYWRNWRYASIEDTGLLILPVGVASFMLVGIVSTLGDPRPVPLSIFLLAGLPAYVGMAAVRLVPSQFGGRWRGALSRAGDYRERVLLVGSGRTAHELVRELQRQSHRYLPVGAVADEPGTEKLRLGGVRVLGRIADLPDLVEALDVDVVAVAMPDAPRSEIRRVVEHCLGTNARIRIVPDLRGALDGVEHPDALGRVVEAEDFLGRQPASADVESCRSYIGGRRVLITGAAGSIGSELARQISRLGPSQLILLDVNESGLFDLAQELRDENPDAPLTLLVRNIEDVRAVAATFRLGADVVFHAAAYKHVSILEDQPSQAIVTNVMGTGNVICAARAARVERFVFVSSDKAVKPNNAMGASKRIGEAIVHGLGAEAGVATAAVRFGNVLGSRGSVLPIFERQIKRGGPVTVTHPEVRRYFMTIPEAVMLVIQAGALTRGNETFLLRMGEEIRIVDLAQKLIRLRGHRVDSDIGVVYTGLQRGEKLAEDLTYPDEELRPTIHPDIFLIDGPPVQAAAVHSALERLQEAADQESPEAAQLALFAEAAALFQPQGDAPERANGRLTAQ